MGIIYFGTPSHEYKSTKRIWDLGLSEICSSERCCNLCPPVASRWQNVLYCEEYSDPTSFKVVYSYSVEKVSNKAEHSQAVTAYSVYLSYPKH